MRSVLFILLATFLVACSVEVKTENFPINSHQYPELDSANYNVAFLIMDGVFNTELTAPYDIYQHTVFRDSIKPMNVFTVANTHNPIRTFEGLQILPDFDYTKDELPAIDILVVPSAEHHLDTDLEDEAMLNFVKEVDETALFITSHCDGAFVLAKAGLLTDAACTTFPGDINAMREMFPELDIRDSTLFVHDGKYITSAGGARSFEASLYLCEYLYGRKNALEIAEGMVIDWDLEKVNCTIISKN